MVNYRMICCLSAVLLLSVVVALECFSQELSSNVKYLGSALVASRDREKTEVISETEWKSQELTMLGVGLAMGDLDGDGKKEVVIIDPSTVYVFRFGKNELIQVAEYSHGSLELKNVDVAPIRKQGPERIYVTGQNRGSVSSFVLEFRNNSLIPVIENVPFFLHVIHYPTVGPILLGQRKGLRKMYDGPIYRMEDKGNSLEPGERFGVPLKVPIFGFAIGDLAGSRSPLVAAYDRNDNLRVYEPSGKRRFVSQEYYGGSDVLLRWEGPEVRKSDNRVDDQDAEFFRPRILTYDSYSPPMHQIIVSYHSSKTRRILSRTKMLEEGQIIGLRWNGEALVEVWSTPKLQGMISDFTFGTLPGSNDLKIFVLERKKTDWLSFLRSRSQVRAYDFNSLINK